MQRTTMQGTMMQGTTMQSTTTQPGAAPAGAGKAASRKTHGVRRKRPFLGGLRLGPFGTPLRRCPQPASAAPSLSPASPRLRRARLAGLLPVLALLLGALSLPAAAQTPATPTYFEAGPGNAAFTVAWRSVTGANSYLIEWDANTASGFGKTLAATPGTATRKTIAHSTTNPVVNGTLYKVRLRACSNANPIGATNLDCSGWTATLTVTPGTPGKMGYKSIGWGSIDNTLRVEWGEVAANGSPFTGNDVHYTTSWAHGLDAAATATYFEGSARYPDASKGWVAITRQDRMSPIQIIYGVPFGIYYRVRMRAVNAVGPGPWSEIGYTLVEQVDSPNIAQNVRVTPGDGKLTFSWEAPSKWGSWPPGGYEIYWKLASAASRNFVLVWKSGAQATIGPGETSFEFTGQQQGSVTVTNGTGYNLFIRAWNKRPGTDGSAANDRRATPFWAAFHTMVTGTPTAPSGQQATPTVSLSASPNPVAEGSDVRVTATLSQALPYAATIPLSLTHAHGTAEDGDYGSLSSITVPARFSSATGTITTSQDADTDDETFTVALDLANLPSYVETGGPSSTAVTITITDDDTAGQQTTRTLLESCASHLPSNAVSVAEVRGWRDSHSGAAHVLRWNRLLKALGDDVDAGISALTVAESKTNESRFMRSRWARVTATLEAIRTCLGGSGTGSSPQPQPRTPPQAHYADLLSDMYDWRDNDPQLSRHKSHTDRLDRVLLAFGEPVADATLTPMTPTQAQKWADEGWDAWIRMTAALRAIDTGTSGADTLTGTGDDDFLVGLAGADTLSGQGGDDELRGGDGDDDLTGGAGDDRFVFFTGETGANAITDFASGDVIVLIGDGWSSAADIVATVQAIGSAGYRYTLASGLTVETTNNRPLRTEDFVTQ